MPSSSAPSASESSATGHLTMAALQLALPKTQQHSEQLAWRLRMQLADRLLRSRLCRKLRSIGHRAAVKRTRSTTEVQKAGIELERAPITSVGRARLVHAAAAVFMH